MNELEQRIKKFESKIVRSVNNDINQKTGNLFDVMFETQSFYLVLSLMIDGINIKNDKAVYLENLNLSL